MSRINNGDPGTGSTSSSTTQPQPSASGIDAIVNSIESGSGGGSGSGSSGGSGGGSGSGNGSTGSIDYSQLFAAFGMPATMIQQINNLMAQYLSSGMDETTAYDNIISQIRGGAIGANYQNGLSWYQYTYSGIQYGMATGLLDSSNPEASYRDYVNQVNNFYKEYMGRDATTAEITAYLQGGLNLSTVNAQLKGQSYANAYANGDSNSMGYSWNALLGSFGNLPNGEKQLSDQEKLALGESMTGYSTPMGDQLNKMLQTATRRMETIFRGTLATPADLQKGGSGLKAPSLSAEVTPDVGPI